MRVLLINPRPNRLANRQKPPSLPLGLLSIASFIKKQGHTVKLVDHAVKPDKIEKHIESFQPDVVALTVHSAISVKAAVTLSKTAQKYNKPVIWGGYVPTQMTELCFREGCVDYIVISEGELTFSELLAAMQSGKSLYDIDGLAFKDKDGIHINTPREFADLSMFPTIDWSLIDAKQYGEVFFRCKKMLYLYFSKGCPAHCTFCYNPSYHRSCHRIRPVEHVVEEIEYLVKNCGVDGIYFADEYWWLDKPTRQRFFNLIREKELKFHWGAQTRLGAFGKQELQELFDAGCRWLLFGIESADPDRLKQVKKGIDLSVAKEIYDTCKSIGITTQSAFIVGYPDETVDEIRKTVKLALHLDANLCPFSLMYLQPLAEMTMRAIEDGRYTPPDSLMEWGKINPVEVVSVNLSKVPDIDLLVLHYYFQWRGFSRKESDSANSYGAAKKLTADALRRALSYGPVDFFVSSFVSLKQFFTVLWYAKAHPKILKKYGLK